MSWGLHLDCDEVLAIIKALEEQEKEQIEQEKEKQHEEKNVQDNDSSSFPTEKVEGFLSDLVPKDLMWHIVYDPDSEEGPTVIICDRSSTSVERRGYQNCMFRFSFFSHHRLNRIRWMGNNFPGQLDQENGEGRAK